MITAGIASLPAREESLILTVGSLVDQVDRIFIALNGYEKIPSALAGNPKLHFDLLDNSLGDTAKFYHVAECNNYYLACDDDLTYPKGYCDYMLSKIKQYHCIVTLHGRQFRRRPIVSYRRSFTLNYHCLHTYDHDVELDVGGTGVMAFDTRFFMPNIKEYLYKNMCDIWTAKQAHEQGVKIMGVAHKNNYLTYISPAETIWRTCKIDPYQTEILKSFLK